MYNPISTYRIQFHKGFNFEDFKASFVYLKKLGFGTVYASPIFESTPGSKHGYDGINPYHINPEIGSEIELRQLSEKLKEQGIGWLQDIVPNHMAFNTGNKWLNDVLEKGKKSRYAYFFDIGWSSELYQGRLMVPFLSSSLEDVIQNIELTVVYEKEDLAFKYFESSYPLNLLSYLTVLEAGDSGVAELNDIRKRVGALEEIENPAVYEIEWNSIRENLRSRIEAKGIEDLLNIINADKKILLQLAEAQHYRLVHWQETDTRINYRRFFTVNSLICLNMHFEGVFSHFHSYIKTLTEEGLFDGLRIDHIDGLYDPARYLQQLKNLFRESKYLIVEKILAANEELPHEWPVQGNTGYDFLAMVNNLFTDKNGEQPLNLFYQEISNEPVPVSLQVREKKSYILYHHMNGELDNLYRLFMQLVTSGGYKEIRAEDIRTTIAEFLIHFPVYRFYGSHFPFSDEESKKITAVFSDMRVSRPDLASPIRLMENLLIPAAGTVISMQHEKILHFYQRCMQYTGPLMAKGVEDTLMYSYNRFISHNEVGDSPESFGCTISQFHELMKSRQQKWPLSLNATSTHDTKRGEDVRARLNILSELSAEWIEKVKEWRELNATTRSDGPDANDEYFIYQTLVGSFPIDGYDDKDYDKRLSAYLQKSMRESKRHSNWTKPNEAYEASTRKFAMALLQKQTQFWNSFHAFVQQVSDLAIINSLAQVLLKFTCPGVPDVYQGTELWDLSLVDPDNRRPVDYAKREIILNELMEQEQVEVLQHLWLTRRDGRIKLWLTHFLLQLRKQNKALFANGSYFPLKVKGKFKDKILAFARIHKKRALIVVVPVQIARISKAQDIDPVNIQWKDTHIILPPRLRGEFSNLVASIKGSGKSRLNVSDIFETVPFAILEMKLEERDRNSGILLHITSLPSSYGIGDLGPEAKNFANFLNRTGQKYWQLLPVNPTEAGQGHSPYSAVSSHAGNTLLISPDLLLQQGLLSEKDLAECRLESAMKANYEDAERNKTLLLDIAWKNNVTRADKKQESFEIFCNDEKEWLDDFAYYMLLKKINEGRPWYEWPEEYKFRNTGSLSALQRDHEDELKAIKWFQFLFYQQWNDLKKYCNDLGIKLIGDLPFYISYDSSDVWSHSEIFSIDEQGKRIGVAGVPPDAFSADGQLWGMPVFRWDILKEKGYSWWINRLKNNRRLFDLVRLDHFRAFSDYWEVPATESTARNGEWKSGPGAEFLKTMKAAMGELPFIAEDLGDIDEPVLKLRDEFNLPGMKVLQFAFGDDFSESDYIPHQYKHNFIVYTGTHDNNTTRGWFRTDADDQVKERIQRYLGRHVSEDEIADVFCRLAMSSVAKTAIIPIQDLLGLDESGRMNIPSVGENNWSWRLLPGQINQDVEIKLIEWTIIYDRG